MTIIDQRGQSVTNQTNIGIEELNVTLAAAEAVTFLHQLSSPPGDFTGRETELADLQAALEDHGGVTI